MDNMELQHGRQQSVQGELHSSTAAELQCHLFQQFAGEEYISNLITGFMQFQVQCSVCIF